MRPPIRSHVLAPGRPGGPTVVFAHGLEDSWTSWQPLAAALDPSWRLIAFDLPWRAGNDYHWLCRRAGSWMADGLSLLDRTPDAIIAHSFGANAIMELLCSPHPPPGRAAVLVCPLYRMPDHEVSWQMFDRSRATFVAHIREGVLAKLGPRAATMEPALLDTIMDMAVDRVGPAGFLTVFNQFAASGELALSTVEVPTLVLAGAADPTLSYPAATALVEAMPAGRLYLQDDYDHFCHVREARSVAAQIANHVDDVRAARTGEYR